MPYADAPTPRKKTGLQPYSVWSNACGYSCVKDPRTHGNVGTKVDILADLADERHELFLLEDGEKKVEVDPETREYRSYHNV